MFNQYLTARLNDGLLHTVLLGEVMQVVASGGPFVVDNVSRESPRFAAHEIVPAGPMFGPKMRDCRGDAALREASALAALSLRREEFDGFGRVMLGTRRANLIWPANLETTPREEGLELCFSLPAGAYATVVMREIMKGDGEVDAIEATD